MVSFVSQYSQALDLADLQQCSVSQHSHVFKSGLSKVKSNWIFMFFFFSNSCLISLKMYNSLY